MICSSAQFSARPGDAPATPSVVAVGPWSIGEFAVTWGTLQRSERLAIAADVDEAIAQIDGAPTPPEIALIAVPRPNEFSDEDLLRLQQAAPLLRLVVVAGPWCAGELRTGTPPTGLIRLYWHELPAWWNAALETVRRGGIPPWSAPLPDRFAGAPFSHSTAPNNSPRRRLVVNAADVGVYETMHSVWTPAGWTVEWLPRRRPGRWDNARVEIPTAGLFDGSQLDAEEARQLEAFCSQMATHDASVVTLLDFPRREHLALVQAAGGATLLGKPYRLEALATLLDELTARR